METTGLRRFASEKTLFFLVAQIMLLMPASEILAEVLTHYSKDFLPSYFHPLVFGAFGILGTLAVLLYKTVELTSPETRGRWYLSDFLYLLLVFFMVISAVFSTNPGMYSYGYFFNSENPADFLGYFCMFYAGANIRSSEYRKKLIFVLLMVEIIHGVFAFFQTFNIQIAFSLLAWRIGAAYGLTPNINYYGGLAVFMLACISGVYLFSEQFIRNKILRLLLIVFAGFGFYVMMGSKSRLVWPGFAVMAAFYVISGLIMIKSKMDRTALKRYFARLLLLFVLYAVMFAVLYNCTDMVREGIERTKQEMEGTVEQGLGSNRLLLWKYGLESVKNHWATGIGLDNFRAVFYEKFGNVEMAFFRDKAHNELIHILVTQGVFAFAFYVFLYLRAVINNVKKIFKGEDESSRALNWIFLAMFLTYAAQACFNTSVISVAPHFWLVLGLLNTCDSPLLSSNKK
ncbi:MAG: O-antigen ligase family protein [Clostridiales bacterium]|nr:O-antigen ligase family protein [Clostridiales bacterium]